MNSAAEIRCAEMLCERLGIRCTNSGPQFIMIADDTDAEKLKTLMRQLSELDLLVGKVIRNEIVIDAVKAIFEIFKLSEKGNFRNYFGFKGKFNHTKYLAIKVNFEERTLMRRFEWEIGISISEYYTMVRDFFICHWLCQGYHIDEVFAMALFRDRSAFGAYIRKTEDMTLAEFQSNLQNTFECLKCCKMNIKCGNMRLLAAGIII